MMRYKHMGKQTWNYLEVIKDTKYKGYLTIMLGTHIGFLVFLIVYAFIENHISWMMGADYRLIVPPYNMSGLLIIALDLFMTYCIGFFEAMCFSLYVSSSWKAMITNVVVSAGSFILLYVFMLENYRLIEYIYGIELWKSGIEIFIKATMITGKEIIGMILGTTFGRIIVEFKKRHYFSRKIMC